MRVKKAILLSLFALTNSLSVCKNESLQFNPSNQCIQFTVGSGTGCAWMCNYCANQLGTNNYYFTDNVCTYQSGEGCVGNPVVGKTYTCCSSAYL
jgi:hypothetical protein